MREISTRLARRGFVLSCNVILLPIIVIRLRAFRGFLPQGFPRKNLCLFVSFISRYYLTSCILAGNHSFIQRCHYHRLPVLTRSCRWGRRTHTPPPGWWSGAAPSFAELWKSSSQALFPGSSSSKRRQAQPEGTWACSRLGTRSALILHATAKMRWIWCAKKHLKSNSDQNCCGGTSKVDFTFLRLLFWGPAKSNLMLA